MPIRNASTSSARTRTSTERTGQSPRTAKSQAQARPATPPWMELEEPATRPLRIYALDPSAGNYVGNVMTLNVKWEAGLKPGPVGAKIAVIDYDPAARIFYSPVDLDDPNLLAADGLAPSESDPRFHQQMVYAVATETIEKFEAALGRRIHWRRADRPAGGGAADGTWRKSDDIWVLNLFPHGMVQANAFYSPEVHGILFGYFTAARTNQGRNLPGQRVFTCLSHDIVAHEVTHAIIDGIRTYFTEPSNPDVLAFHEGFADLAALFSHFSHKDALLDTIQKTGGRLYEFELTPDAAPARAGSAAARGTRHTRGGEADLTAQIATRNPLIELAQQFGEASGMKRGLRSALDVPPNSNDINTRVNDAHFRGSILVAAVFDAYFSVYIKRTADLFRIYRAGGGDVALDELPASLARLLSEQASKTAAEFFQICARAIDYCPPVDVTFGDFLRALITVECDLNPSDSSSICDALMQAFRVRGIFPESASFFSQDALAWPRVPQWSVPPAPGALPPVEGLVFGSPNGLTRAEKDVNGEVLRKYAQDNAARLGFDADPKLPPQFKPYAPSFHPVFRLAPDGSLRTEMVVELMQTKRVPFDAKVPSVGSFPLRAGVAVIISAPEIDRYGKSGAPQVRFAIGKGVTGAEGRQREARQRDYYLALGLLDGNTDDANHFQVNFGLLHQGI